MPYIDLAGLSRYASRQKERLERDYALLRDMQWLRTEKAGAVSLWPAGGTPLKPSVDFLFTETGPASGDKGPENPSTITGVESFRIGHGNKNLFYSAHNSDIYGLAVTYGDDGSIVMDGTTTGTNIITASLAFAPTGFENETVIFSVNNPAVNSNVQMRWGTSSGLWGLDSVNKVRVCTNPPSGPRNFQIRIESGVTLNNFYVRPQVELGSVPSSFELSVQTVQTLPLGSTYYGGTLDVASGVMTVTWEGVVLDGTENWTDGASVGDGVYRYTLLNDYNDRYHPLGNRNQTCSHFTYLQNWTSATVHWYSNSPAGNAWFFTDAQTSITDWKAWLAAQKVAGTPVTFAAKVTPYTVALTPTQILSLSQTDKYTPRINTIYTDAQAVQVGYVKSPIRDEYELQQAVIAQGGNV